MSEPIRALEIKYWELKIVKSVLFLIQLICGIPTALFLTHKQHDELCAGKIFYAKKLAGHWMCSQLICKSNSSQGLMPLGGMRWLLNIPGHPIITTKKLIISSPQLKLKKPQFPIIFLIISQIQLYFVCLLSRNIEIT